VRSNWLFDMDTHQQCALRRVNKPTPRGAQLVRAG
jgi:hypothetical protein